MAISRSVTVSGLEEVLRNLRAYGENARSAAKEAIRAEAMAIEETSKSQYVPVDTGTLRRDHGFVDEEAKQEGDKVSITFGYRGPYAASVHENPRAGKTGGVSPSGRKYKHWATTGSWKFLEIPLMAAESGMLGRIADRMRSSLGGKLSGLFYGGR